QALAPDARSLAIRAELAAPPSHRQPGFLNTHGRQDDMATCAFCHTRESCTTCHVESVPRAVTRLASAGGGRGVGAVVERRPPDTHGADFSEEHASIAEASPRTCASCHARAECLECHIPGPGAGERLYHDAAFLTRHPAAAYARETSCADCHNTASFCASCHEQSGLVATGPLRRGYHDASPTFVFGHGQAARQSLESCTACHAERDCLTCHSAEGGRRFNPHGPGFDPERLRRKNPEMCSACHGAAIPGG
ncbi:MAG TPA: cytochrome c3 family protein, partial [Gemmatimonadales bacterium]|nr:cytochrome c3 family protein [Gemmatimonadales bacterium]